MVTSRWLVLAVALNATVLLGCTEAPSAPPSPITYTLAPARQWSGGQVLLRAPTIQGVPGYHLVVAGKDSLVPTPVNDSTVSFTLPLGPSGPVAVRVPGAAGGDSVGSVERVGYADSRSVDSVVWALTIWRPGGSFAVLGYTPSGTAASADLESGAATVYPGLIVAGDYAYGAMNQTPVADAYVLRDSATAEIGIWRLAPTALRVGGGPVGAGVYRQLEPVSDNIWITTGHHSYTVLRTADSTLVRQGSIEEPLDIINSPDGQYTTFVAYSRPLGTHGIPMLNSHTGDSLYVLPLELIRDATFTADSRVLYFVGGGNSLSVRDTLIAMDPANAAILGRAALPDPGLVFALKYEPGTDRLYLAAQLGADLEVLVYDATTLDLLGRLPGEAVCVLQCGGGDLVADPGGERLFVVAGGSVTTVQKFDLVP